jgi:hypothetical protein
MPVQRSTTWRSARAARPLRPSRPSLLLGLGLGQLLFQLRDDAVGQLAGLGQIALALGLIQLGPGLVELFLEPARAGELVALGLPLARSSRRLLLQLGQLLLQLLKPVLRRRSSSFFSASASICSCRICAVERVELLGLLSTSIRRRRRASSIRSIALSGRNRSVM